MDQSTHRPSADKVALGASGIQISALGIGTWAWGDSMVWQYGHSHGDADLEAAYQASLAHGIDFFDSAEAYGTGRSETLLGQFYRAAGWPAVIASKFMPYPWRLSKRNLARALAQSLKRLGLPRIDLYQLHWPFPPVPIPAWMDAMADAVQAGLVAAVGVSNYNVDQMRRAYDALAARGIPLASNQVQYNLLYRRPESNGLLGLCQGLGVTLIAYSPLRKGLLTGKYNPEKPPPGLRRLMFRQDQLAQARPIVNLLREIGQDHGGKTPAQVALNWIICKGAVPIPGAKNARQAVENAGALGWRLSAAEVAALDAVSEGRMGARGDS